MSWIWLLVVLAVGLLGGYILKDRTTEEYVSNVTMHKPKVKGRNNKMDADQVTEVHMYKMSRKEKREARKAKRKTE